MFFQVSVDDSKKARRSKAAIKREQNGNPFYRIIWQFRLKNVIFQRKVVRKSTSKQRKVIGKITAIIRKVIRKIAIKQEICSSCWIWNQRKLSWNQLTQIPSTHWQGKSLASRKVVLSPQSVAQDIIAIHREALEKYESMQSSIGAP